MLALPILNESYQTGVSGNLGKVVVRTFRRMVNDLLKNENCPCPHTMGAVPEGARRLDCGASRKFVLHVGAAIAYELGFDV